MQEELAAVRRAHIEEIEELNNQHHKESARLESLVEQANVHLVEIRECAKNGEGLDPQFQKHEEQ